jgi:hypothetical protein
MVAIATKSRRLALLCELDISDCLLACTVIFIPVSLLYLVYTKPGVKIIIKLWVLIRGKYRTSIEHVRYFISFPSFLNSGINGVTFLEMLGKGDRVTGELLWDNELPKLNVFVERSRWLEPLQENIPQAGQHFCYSAAPNELLQGVCDT